MLKVYYRICPFPNGKSALYTDDKLELTRFCLQSFVRTFRNVKDLEMVFILDSCPDEYASMIMKEVPFKKDILAFEKLGNEGSYFLQLGMASTHDGPVLLQEDDYFYLEDSGKFINDALETVGKWIGERYIFFTPYDHPDYYDKEWHKYEKTEHLIGDHKWQKVRSTCLTFATHGKAIRELIDTMKEYGIADRPMFEKLSDEGYYLFSPIPTLATHMDKEFLAPNINWQEEWKKYETRK